MSRIFTRTGDEGMTRLADGTQVQKTDIRIEANGCLDELNAILGIAKALSRENCDGRAAAIEHIQHNLTDIMATVAGCQKDMTALEEEIRKMECRMEAENGMFNFVTPGCDTENALLHTARAKARTCERRLWEACSKHNIPNQIPVFINRLSDFLFFLAEKKNRRAIKSHT